MITTVRANLQRLLEFAFVKMRLAAVALNKDIFSLYNAFLRRHRFDLFTLFAKPGHRETGFYISALGFIGMRQRLAQVAERMKATAGQTLLASGNKGGEWVFSVFRGEGGKKFFFVIDRWDTSCQSHPDSCTHLGL